MNKFASLLTTFLQMVTPRTASTNTRKRSWRQRYRHLLESIPLHDYDTLSLPRNQFHKRDEFKQSLFSRSDSVRKYMLDAERGATEIMTHTAAVAIVVLFIIFFLGAVESSIQTRTVQQVFTSPYEYGGGNTFHVSPTFMLSPIELELHQRHVVPIKYFRLLSPQQQFQLLQLLSTSASDEPLSPKPRKAVFATVRDCNHQQCIRAIASAAAYAQSTERVALIFITASGDEPLTHILQLQEDSFLSNYVMLIDREYPVEGFHGDIMVKDWAEFSVIKAVVPGTIFVNSSLSNPRNHVSQQPRLVGDMMDYPVGDIATIGSTNIPATFDNLAPIDTHVSVSLSEVVWSKYSPRTTQEEILSKLILDSGKNWSKELRGASILGRRKETRDITATDSILKDNFHIPVILLQGMSSLARKLLLLKLMSKKRRGLSNPRVIFLHAQYGLGNRLRALGSAMAFARRTDRVLVLIWVSDHHLNCNYTDLFVTNDEFVISDGFETEEGWPFKNTQSSDPAAKHVKWYNYMRVNGRAANTADVEVTDDKDHHIYVSTCYVIQSPVTPFIIRTQSSYWQVLRTLTPHIHVLRLVERFANYPMSTMIGVHIRGRSIKSDINGVTAANYTEESSRRTDYWRNLTQVKTFIDEMRRQPLDQLFYVAADQKEVLGRLESEFPARIFYTPRRCDSREKRCLPFALADILLLARCSSIRGSYWSSFSELSVRIGGSRFLLAGIDFGRP